MSDEYVSKADAIGAIWHSIDGELFGELESCAHAVIGDADNAIESLEPADVVPVRHGTWMPIVSYNNTYKCSECGRLLVDITDGLKMVAKNYPYCHCGAKMDAQGGG